MAPDNAGMTDAEIAIADTRRWLERAVIGLNLCPFAKAPHVKGQIHFAACVGGTRRDLLAQLRAELQALAAADPAERETTLLVVPDQFPDFLDFNDFLDEAEALLDALDLQGVLQIAPFHPRFQFEGTAPEDIGNATNRSPHPTLHLLREDSVERAVQALPEAEAIWQANVATLERLGAAGWAALGVGATDRAQGEPPGPAR